MNATIPAPRDIAHRNVAADACTDCTAAAGAMCEPYCPATLGAEFMQLDEEGNDESLICVDECRNQSHLDGFYPITAAGKYDECTEEWDRDGRLLNCGSCGRVVSEAPGALIAGTHRQVLFQLDTPARDAEPATTTVADLRDGERFSVDGGTTWHTCAEVLFGNVAVYLDGRRGPNAPTIRIEAARDAVALVLR